jgi:broad specificity phosphatase PhoE
MSHLYLVRHGQASFGSDDYDVLSDRGLAQSRALGAHWAAHLPPVDAIYAGPRCRHRDTERGFREGHGRPLPEPQTESDLDEFPIFELIRVLGKTEPATLAQIAAAATTPHSAVQIIDEVAGRWQRGEIAGDGLESAAQFATRVNRCLTTILDAQPRGTRILVITSAGPIAQTASRVLGLAPAQLIPTASALYNASISQFRFRSAADLSLLTFNETPHLATPALFTHR